MTRWKKHEPPSWRLFRRGYRPLSPLPLSQQGTGHWSGAGQGAPQQVPACWSQQSVLSEEVAAKPKASPVASRTAALSASILFFMLFNFKK